ncbi:MAG: sugar phosphate isomerase/epimerase [Streptomycetaceae bacterium]|nr:sugar phosphate isomerase/epimerase [Streptomycetaceae bacterium]
MTPQTVQPSNRKYTLFTGQWVDLPFEKVAMLAADWGYDGLEIACSGDHFDVRRAAADDAYIAERREILDRYGLGCWAISNHLVGQAVSDHLIDARHRAILPPHIWGDGDPDGVRRRAAEEMRTTAAAARRFGVDTVIGFTGSPIWHTVAMFPPVTEAQVEAGYREFARVWGPILDTYREHGVRFALEVHPSEIAYDYWTTLRTLEVLDRHPAFGLTFDPSHMIWQDIDPVTFLYDFRAHILHVDCKDTRTRFDGRTGRLGSHLPWGDPRRGWDFVSSGRGDAPWEAIFRTLNAIGYTGPISVEWEDAGMDRMRGAPEALRLLKDFDFAPPAQSFDAAFAVNSEAGDDNNEETP